MRWKIETGYDTLKNKIQFENFSGRTKNAILQDFWACITLANLAAAAFNNSREIVAGDRILSGNKYTYIPNLNQMIGTLKDDFIVACVTASRGPIDKIINEVAAPVVPVRPGRSNPRKKDPKKRQHPINRKSNC
jgi:hypothetical protein